MAMTIDEALSHLGTYSSTMGSGQTTQAQHEESKRVAIDTMRKYQMFQADYEARLKADMVAMLEDLRLDFQEAELAGVLDNKELIFADEVDDIIQQRINSLKAESEDT